MAHFYLSDAPLAAAGGLVSITGAEAKHAASVSRVRVGERLLIGDGRGTVAETTVETASASLVELRVHALTVHPAPRSRFTLVQALAKGDRDELAVQAATELGVDRIVPWQSERSVSRWSDGKAEKGAGRWRTIAREAVKQSLRPWLPEVAALTSTAEIEKLAGQPRMLLLEPTAEVGLVSAVSGYEGDLVLVVGPEGGLSPNELTRLTSAGARSVRLGTEVLRTSTAGPAAVAALSAITGRWT